MTKSFSLSVLVPALSGLAALVPVAAWHDFNTPGWQGVSVLPALFPLCFLGTTWRRNFNNNNALPTFIAALICVGWQAILWATVLTQPHQGSLISALIRVFFEFLYAAPSVVLVGIAGTIASLGLMMSAPPVRGPQD